MSSGAALSILLFAASGTSVVAFTPAPSSSSLAPNKLAPAAPRREAAAIINLAAPNAPTAPAAPEPLREH